MEFANPPHTPDPYAAAERHRIGENTRAMSASGLLIAVIIGAYVLAFDPGNAGVAVGAVVAMALGAALIRRGHVRYGTLVCIGTVHAAITLLTVRHGADAGVHFGFALIGLATLAVFETWAQRWAGFALVLATGVLAVSGRLDFLLAEPDVDVPYEIPFYTLVVMTATYWLSDDLLRINRAFRSRSRAVVDDIGARSTELERELRRLGRQSEDIRLANAALAEEVARGEHVQRQLRVSREQLEQFVYAASHDLKEPLRSISGFVQLLRRRLSAHADADLDAYTEIVLASSAGMSRLLDGLLAYSRVDADEASAEPVDLHRLALVARHEALTAAPHPDTVIEVSPGLGTATCPKRALREILRVVLDNAVKFVPPGEAPRVEIGPCAVAGETCLVVRDHGIGIEADFRERVFLLFQRLNRVDEYEGAGIGLALARKLARANGIRLAIASPPEGPGVCVAIACPPLADSRPDRPTTTPPT